MTDQSSVRKCGCGRPATGAFMFQGGALPWRIDLCGDRLAGLQEGRLPTIRPPTSPGLTLDERQVLGTLVRAWDGWLKLPGKHPDDDGEFRFHLHALQMLVAYRVACRADPAAFGRHGDGRE